MALLQSSATAILGIMVAYFILVNILQLPYAKDLVQAEGNIQTALTQSNLDELETEEENVSLNQVEETLRRQFTTGSSKKISNKLPDAMVQQVIRNEPVSDVQASNSLMYEKDADFASERTNIAQFVSSNPSAFFGDLRNNAYVPDVNVWNEQGAQMYNDLVTTRPNKTLNAANFENTYKVIE